LAFGNTRGPAVASAAAAAKNTTEPLAHRRTSAAPDEVLGKDATVDADVIEGVAELVDSVVGILTAAVVGVPALSLFAAELVACVQALAVAVTASAMIINGLARDPVRDLAFSGCPLKGTGGGRKLIRRADDRAMLVITSFPLTFTVPC